MDGGFLDMLRQGGVFSMLGLVCGIITTFGALGAAGLLVGSLVKRIDRGPVLGCGGALLLAVFMLVGIGAAGYFIGISEMEAALASVDPDNKEALEARGRELAGYPLTLTGILAIFPGLVAMAVLIRGFLPPKEGSAG